MRSGKEPVLRESRTCSLSDDAGSKVAGGSKGAGIARTKVSLLSSSLHKGEKAKNGNSQLICFSKRKRSDNS